MTAACPHLSFFACLPPPPSCDSPAHRPCCARCGWQVARVGPPLMRLLLAAATGVQPTARVSEIADVIGSMLSAWEMQVRGRLGNCIRSLLSAMRWMVSKGCPLPGGRWGSARTPAPHGAACRGLVEHAPLFAHPSPPPCVQALQWLGAGVSLIPDTAAAPADKEMFLGTVAGIAQRSTTGPPEVRDAAARGGMHGMARQDMHLPPLRAWTRLFCMLWFGHPHPPVPSTLCPPPSSPALRTRPSWPARSHC